jgi:hypothetical protein
MLINKKAAISFFLVSTIAVLFAFGITTLVVTKAYSKASDKEAETVCQKSVALRAGTLLNVDHGLVDGRFSPVPVLCRTIDREIEGNREEIKFQVADSIARCWKMFGEGRFEKAFKENQANLIPDLLGTADQPNQCFNCYNLLVTEEKIDDNKEFQGNINGVELTTFMLKNHPTWLKEDTGFNYIRYIQQYGGDGMFLNLLPTEGIGARSSYSVSFLPKNTEEGKSNWVPAIGLGIGAAAAVTGALICTIGTGGLCTPLLIKVVTGTAFLGAKITAAGTVYSLVQEGDLKPINVKDFFKQREFSSVYLSGSVWGQQQCGSGDIAGR